MNYYSFTQEFVNDVECETSIEGKTVKRRAVVKPLYFFHFLCTASSIAHLAREHGTGTGTDDHKNSADKKKESQRKKREVHIELGGYYGICAKPADCNIQHAHLRRKKRDPNAPPGLPFQDGAERRVKSKIKVCKEIHVEPCSEATGFCLYWKPELDHYHRIKFRDVVDDLDFNDPSSQERVDEVLANAEVLDEVDHHEDRNRATNTANIAKTVRDRFRACKFPIIPSTKKMTKKIFHWDDALVHGYCTAYCAGTKDMEQQVQLSDHDFVISVLNFYATAFEVKTNAMHSQDDVAAWLRKETEPYDEFEAFKIIETVNPLREKGKPDNYAGTNEPDLPPKLPVLTNPPAMPSGGETCKEAEVKTVVKEHIDAMLRHIERKADTKLTSPPSMTSACVRPVVTLSHPLSKPVGPIPLPHDDVSMHPLRSESPASYVSPEEEKADDVSTLAKADDVSTLASAIYLTPPPGLSRLRTFRDFTLPEPDIGDDVSSVSTDTATVTTTDSPDPLPPVTSPPVAPLPQPVPEDYGDPGGDGTVVMIPAARDNKNVKIASALIDRLTPAQLYINCKSKVVAPGCLEITWRAILEGYRSIFYDLYSTIPKIKDWNMSVEARDYLTEECPYVFNPSFQQEVRVLKSRSYTPRWFTLLGANFSNIETSEITLLEGMYNASTEGDIFWGLANKLMTEFSPISIGNFTTSAVNTWTPARVLQSIVMINPNYCLQSNLTHTCNTVTFVINQLSLISTRCFMSLPCVSVGEAVGIMKKNFVVNNPRDIENKTQILRGKDFRF